MFEIFSKLFPVERVALAAAVEPFEGHSHCLVVETAQCARVSADAIVLIMASKLGRQYRPPVLRFLAVAYVSEPVVHLGAFDAEFLSAGFAPDDELATTAGAAIVSEAQKVEGVWSSVLPFRVFSLESAVTDHPGFCWMQFELELCKPLPEFLLDVSCVAFIPHHADEIIGIAHQLTHAICLWFYYFFEPQVEHIVQEYVGEDRA